MGAVDSSHDSAARFAQAYRAYHTQVRRFIVARVGDPDLADDLASEVFLRAWRSWDRFDPARGPAIGWLLAIAGNVVVDARRRSGRQVPVDVEALEHIEDAYGGPEAAVLRAELRARVVELVAGLPAATRLGLALRYAQGLSSREIAEVVGASPVATKAMLHRATRSLRGPAREHGLRSAA